MEKQILEHTDLVCGMRIVPEKAKHSAEYGGVTYYFCSDSCRERFQSEPDRYVAASGDYDE